MASRRTERQTAFVLSVLVHAGIVAALTFSLPLSPSRPDAGPNVVPIETVMIDAGMLDAEVARIEAAEQRRIEEEQRRQQEEQDRIRREQEQAERLAREAEEQRIEQERVAREAEQQRLEQEQQAAERERIRLQQEAEAAAEAERQQLARLEEERLQREAEEERRRQEEVERQRREAEAEAERQRQEELARQEAERQRRIAEIEAQVARAAAEEEAARQARESGQLDQWIRAIQNKITQHWNRPPTADTGTECMVVVNLIPTGEVISVNVESCNRDATVVRSVENAVLQASPLPLPSTPSLMQRVIRVRFKPDE